MEKDPNAVLPYMAARSLTDRDNATISGSAQRDEWSSRVATDIPPLQQTTGLYDPSLRNASLPYSSSPGAALHTSPAGTSIQPPASILQQASGLSLPGSSLTTMSPSYNGSIAATQGQTTPMPPKNVLFEACTIHQPLHAALREKFSTGTYYFLSNSV